MNNTSEFCPNGQVPGAPSLWTPTRNLSERIGGTASFTLTGGFVFAAAGPNADCPADLNGDLVLVPRLELVAARVAESSLKTSDPNALLFGAAALGIGDWSEVTRVAKRLGRARAPIAAAFALGLTLFVVTLTLNVIALHIVRKYREQYE